MAFNGVGSEEAIDAAGGAPDPLTDAFLANKSQFHWINHTWSHLQLDTLSQTQIRNEIAQNIQWAQAPQRGLPIDPTELVTGEHSGLHNPAMPAAISQTGIRWIAADNSREPTPYAIGQATTVPRYPSNVYYNVGTQAEQLDEYNHIYLPPALGGKCVDSSTNTCLGAPATWQQYVDSEANIMLDHLMGNDPKPHYAHQSNVAEDGVLYPVLEALLARYRPYFNTPIVQLTQAQIGQEMQRQRAWRAAGAGISAYVQDGKVNVVNSTASPIDVPLTGTSVGGLYGGQRSGWTTRSARLERIRAERPRKHRRANGDGLRRGGGRHTHRHDGHMERYADHRTLPPVAALQHPGRRLREHPRRHRDDLHDAGCGHRQAPAGGRLGGELDLFL